MKITPIPRISALTVPQFQQQFGRPSRPIVLTQLAKTWPALRLWQIENLKSLIGHWKVSVQGSDNELEVAFENVPFETMRISDYLDLIVTPRHGERRPYWGNFSFGIPAAQPYIAPLRQHFAFPDFFPDETEHEIRLWIAGAGQKSTIHNDTYHNVNAQICGTKSFLLFAPQEYPRLYTRNMNPYVWASPVDPRNPDLAKYPLYDTATAWQCTLNPGEAVFIPRFWWHHASAETASVNLNMWSYSPENMHQVWKQE